MRLTIMLVGSVFLFHQLPLGCHVSNFLQRLVIGGGTAGITIASRLAEPSDVLVAIIEAGGFYEVNDGNYGMLPSLALSAPFWGRRSPSSSNLS